MKTFDAPETISENIKKYCDILNVFFPHDLSALILQYHISGNLYEHITLTTPHTYGITQMLCYNNLLITASDDFSICMWDIDANGCALKQIARPRKGLPNSETSLTLCGNYLVAGSRRNIIYIWDLTALKDLVTYNHQQPITALTTISSRGIIALGDPDGIVICSIQTESQDLSINKMQQIVSPCTVTACAATKRKNLIVGHKDGSITFLTRSTPQKNVGYTQSYRALYKHRGTVNIIAQRDDVIVSGSDDETIVLLHTAHTGKPRVIIKNTIGRVNSLVIDDENNIIAGGLLGTIIYNIRTQQYMSVDRVTRNMPARALALHPYDGRCIMGDERGNLSIWKRDFSA